MTYYLMFSADRGNREDENVYYSVLVESSSPEKAYEILKKSGQWDQDEIDDYVDFIAFEDKDILREK